jgi:hypothetical protein
MRSAFSMMSARLSATLCLEGTPAIPIYVSPQAGLLNWFWQEIHPTADQLGQAPFKRSEREQPDASCRVQLRDEIHVAIDSSVTTGNGTKKRKVTNTGAMQLRLVSPQRSNHVFSHIGRSRRAHRA